MIINRSLINIRLCTIIFLSEIIQKKSMLFLLKILVFSRKIWYLLKRLLIQNQGRLIHKQHQSKHLKILVHKHHSYLVSATSWIIHDTNNKKTIGLRQHLQKQIASLTKMMTCVIVIQMMKKYCIEKNIILRVSKNAAMMIGTSANLRYGYWIRLIDLLYGLMLPSGNDAACLLAQNFGLLIFYEKLKPKEKKYADIESIDITSYQNTSHFINQFVKEMNKKAKLLGMNSTSFANPHGLPNNLNYSTAKDMLILSRYCRSVPQFMQIASTKFYKCVHYLNQEQNEQQFIEFQWKNTNKLLYQGWEGLKTGQTMNAGACLASFKQGIFIIVLNCGNAQKRFEDTLTLHQWYINQIKRDNHS